MSAANKFTIIIQGSFNDFSKLQRMLKQLSSNIRLRQILLLVPNSKRNELESKQQEISKNSGVVVKLVFVDKLVRKGI